MTINNDDGRYDLVDVGRPDRRDIDALMSCWGSNNSDADVTNDGIVNSANLQAVQAAM